MKYIVSTIDIDPISKARLVAALPVGWEYKNESEIQAEGLGSVEILLLSGTLPEAKVRSMPGLRFVQTFSAGVDHIDFGVLPSSVVLCSNSGAFAGPIAEFILGAAIALARDLREHDQNLREGKFVRSPIGLYLRGKTIGILGTGGIGQSTAHLAKCFGMRTIGVNTTGKAVPDFDGVATIDKLNDVLRESDVVVIALPLNLKTRNLLGRDQFSIMKPNSILVNVARGAIIDQGALYEFLKDHPNAKAAIDVWWRYPKQDRKFAQDFPISELPNVLSTPHYSGDVEEATKLGSDGAVDNVIRYLRGEELKAVVDRKDYLGLAKPAGLLQ